MKLFFSCFLVVFISTQALLAKEIWQEYSIQTKGITIGSLTWGLKITENKYEISVDLKDKGFFSGFYSFSGNYEALGIVKKNKLFPTRYIQNWETSNKKKYVELNFKDNAVESMFLKPKEIEFARIQYKKLEGYKDPLSSFISILLTKAQSYTIDGRRAYLMFPSKEGNKILVKEYINIWADHKRNDLEYLEIYQDEKKILPKKIIIKFKGSLFYLKKI